MKTTKLSLANAQNLMSISEMKSIMAGSGSGTCYTAQCRSSSAHLGTVDVTSCTRAIVEAACTQLYPSTSMADTTCNTI